MNQSTLRKQCRSKRKALSKQQQFQHAKLALIHFSRSFPLRSPRKIGLFISVDGELATDSLIQKLKRNKHAIFLPVLTSVKNHNYHHNMVFAPEEKSPLLPNKFNILEPQTPHQYHLTAQQLDIILVPLSCFDRSKNRIGMGGGYYDRALRFKHYRKIRRPILIGWAHACQQVDKIPVASWDIPLDYIVTEKGVS